MGLPVLLDRPAEDPRIEGLLQFLVAAFGVVGRIPVQGPDVGQLVGGGQGAFLFLVPGTVQIVEVLDSHVPGWPVQGQDEVGGEQVAGVVRIDEDVRERGGGVADVLGAGTGVQQIGDQVVDGGPVPVARGGRVPPGRVGGVDRSLVGLVVDDQDR